MSIQSRGFLSASERERALFSSEAQGPSYIALYSKDNVRHIGLERGCHCSSAWSGGNAALLLLCSENDPAAQLQCLLLTWMDPCRRCKWFPASPSQTSLSLSCSMFPCPQLANSEVHFTQFQRVLKVSAPCCPVTTVSNYNIDSCTFIISQSSPSVDLLVTCLPCLFYFSAFFIMLSEISSQINSLYPYSCLRSFGGIQNKSYLKVLLFESIRRQS